MLDVVPPARSQPTGTGRRKRSKPSANSVVELDWRLPARLRRPVHEELQRQRRRRRAREAIVKFERRPLYPSNPTSPEALPAGRQVRGASQEPVPPNRGAEHHTGDVYQTTRPFLAASIPPYAGSFIRRKAPPPARQPRTVAPARTQPVASRQAVPIIERDVPYQWATAPSPQREARSNEQPATVAASTSPRRKRFALPLHLSIWPLSKKKVQITDSLTR